MKKKSATRLAGLLTGLLALACSAIAQGWNVEPVCYIPFWPYANDIEYLNDLAYIAVGQAGLCLVDLTNPNDPTQTAYVLDSTMHTTGHIDIEGNLMLLTGQHFTPPNIYRDCIVFRDLADPLAPGYLSSIIFPGNMVVHNAVLSGNYAYLSLSTDELAIYDITDPRSPLLVSTIDLWAQAGPMAVSGNLLFVGEGLWVGAGGLEVVDISDPAAPQVVGFCNTGGAVCDLEFWNGYLVAACFTSLRVIDVSVPSGLQIVGSLAMNASLALSISGNYTYGGNGNGFSVVDLSNPFAPRLLGTCSLPDEPAEVVANENLAYVADYEGGLRVVDTVNPLAPLEIGSCGESNQISEMDLSNNYAYLCGDWWGFLTVNTVVPDSIIGQYEAQNYMTSIGVYGEYAYAAGNIYFWILNASNPSNPILLSTLNFGQNIYPCEVIISGSVAYIVGGHLFLVNIANPYQPQQLSAIYWLSASGACIEDTLAFVAGVSGDYPNYDGYIKVYNVSNPAAPQQVGYLWLPEPALDIQISGNYAYVAESGAGLCVVNVANYAVMQVLATYNTAGSARQVVVSDNHVFLADEAGGILVFDVSISANPILTGSYDTPGMAYDLAVDGNLVYVADHYYFSTYDASAALAPVTVTLSPVNPPIQIPPTGGSFSFNALLVNATSSSQTFDVWIMVQLPNQSWYGPVLGPLSLTLQAGATLTRLRNQSVPAGAPAGEYWYEARVGDYPTEIWDTGGFGFTKLGAVDADFGLGDWTNAGEDFGETTGKIIAEKSSFQTSISPNPFNAATAISYQLPVGSRVILKVYDTGGRLVATLVEGWRGAGEHRAVFDGSSLASGIYICRLEAGDFVTTQKLVLLK